MTDEDSVLITLSCQDLANMVGTVNETLARILHEFKRIILLLWKFVK